MYIEIKTDFFFDPNKVLLVFGGGPVFIIRTVRVFNCIIIWGLLDLTVEPTDYMWICILYCITCNRWFETMYFSYSHTFSIYCLKKKVSWNTMKLNDIDVDY